jgi:lipopolysaccharide transport system permease protein
MALVLQVWFFSAPIVYTQDLVESNLGPDSISRKIFELNFALNPLVYFVDVYRNLLYDMRMPAASDLAVIVVTSVASLVIGYWAFGRLEGRVAEEL